MHLISRLPQTVRIPDHTGTPREIRFEAGEVIVTEHSYKYSVEEFNALAADAGCAVKACWLDDEHLFSVYWLETDVPVPDARDPDPGGARTHNG